MLLEAAIAFWQMAGEQMQFKVGVADLDLSGTTRIIAVWDVPQFLQVFRLR